MLPIIALLLCAMDITTAHLMSLTHDEYAVMYQAYIALLCLGAVVSDGSQRDRSILSVLLIWAFWILVTDQFNVDVPDVALSLEAAFFTSFVLWAIVRPYFFASQSMAPWNVTIVFYQGRNAPVISELSSLVGFPFSSVAIMARGKILRAKKDGFLHMTDSKWVNKEDYVFVDSGIKATPEHIAAMEALSGSPVKRFGLRTGCIAALRPLLESLGMTPNTKVHLLPSIFYYQCVRQANG